MPLENLTGNRFIDSLNPEWPLGTDFPSQGDDHLRGIKNVVQKSFPEVKGQVTRTHIELSRGSVPAGSVMIFHQMAAPAGWTRVKGIDESHLLRVVHSGAAGGTRGGTHDPVLNDKIPAHKHNVPEHTTGNQNADHTHSGSTSSNTVKTQGEGTRVAPQAGGVFVLDLQGASFGYSLPHDHTVTTSKQSANHKHVIAELKTADNVGGAAWTPRYMDVILCVKEGKP